MSWLPETVGLTGATGMAGMHIAATLERAAIHCVRLDRSHWDMRNWAPDEDLDNRLGRCEAIVHAGAAVPSPGHPVPAQEILDVNVRACLCLGDWARRRGKPVTFLSGATVYASIEKAGIKETDPVTTRPSSGLYGFSKLLAEQVLDHLSGLGLRLCVLRPSSVYGAGMRETRMIAAMLAKARRGDEIRLEPPVNDTVNLVHAGDLAQAVLAAMRREAWDVFNVAGPEAVSIAEIAHTCVEVAGNGKVIMPADDGPEGLSRYRLDFSKATAAFAYAPRVDLREGLRRTMDGRC